MRFTNWYRGLEPSVSTYRAQIVLFALVAGLIVGPHFDLIILGGVAVVAALLPARKVGCIAAVAVLAGGLIADARTNAWTPRKLDDKHGQAITANVVVLTPFRERQNGRLSARVRIADGAVVVLRVRKLHPLPAVGAVLRVQGRILDLDITEQFQELKGAQALLEAYACRNTQTTRAGPFAMLDRVRIRAQEGLTRSLAPQESALVHGMVLGQPERISAEVRSNFQRSGLSHLIAVSGLSVMLLSALTSFLAAAVGLGLRGRLITTLIVVIIYIPLAGSGPSIQRAGIMGAIGFLATLASRPNSRWYALGFAAAATLIINPRASLDPSWQLSFASVIGLFTLMPGCEKWLRDRHVPGPIAEAGAMTFSATLATAPLVAFCFKQVSLASIPVNIAAVPAVAPLMWLGMLSSALAQISTALVVPLNAVNAWLLGYIELIAHVGARLPFGVFSFGLSKLELVGVYILGGLIVYALTLRGRSLLRRKYWSARDRFVWFERGCVLLGRRPAVSIAVALTVAGTSIGGVWVLFDTHENVSPPKPGELIVSFLDIGQGDATLFQHHGTTVLVDTGPPDGPIMQRLQELGVKRLDALMLTHAESDHEGAALEVIRKYHPRVIVDGGAGWDSPVQRFLERSTATDVQRVGGDGTRNTPVASTTKEMRRIDPERGMTIRIGEMRFSVLWPLKRPRFPPNRKRFSPNNSALVTIVSVGDFKMFMPADAESHITNHLPVQRVDVIKVAHHGSKDPGLPMLLRKLKPRIAGIEVGRHNSYGHPTPTTLAALKAVGEVVRTDRDGTVRLHVHQNKMRLEKLGVKPFKRVGALPRATRSR